MGIKGMILRLANACGYHIKNIRIRTGYPILRPMDRNGIEILANEAFQQSCRSLRGSTLLDTPRLANLWQLCQLTDQDGAMAEIGTFMGGGGGIAPLELLPGKRDHRVRSIRQREF